MTSVFLRIVNISFTAGWLILAVIALRLLLRKAPKWLICLLWALVALRLLIPFSIESALSLIPSNEVISESIVSNQAPSIDTGFVVVNNTVNPIISDTFSSETQVSHNPIRIFVLIASIVWIIGIAMMLVYAIISFGKLKRQVSTAIPFEKESYSYPTFVCDDIQSPFILGIIKPLIFIPSSLDEETIGYVYAHENAHIKRHDHWWKPLGFLLLSVYWFNPLCWVAYILLCKDIEAACDEKVIKDKDKSYLALYSQALLECAVQRKRISACPLAFGETGVKSRVKGILSYKKPAFWIIVIAVVAIIVAAVCFLTNPKKTNLSEKEPPELMIGADNSDTMLQASTYGYHWSWKEKGKNQEVIADGISPFDDSNIVTVYLDDEKHTLKLNFGQEPDSVKVACIEEEYIKDENNYESNMFQTTYDTATHTIEIPPTYSLYYIIEAEWFERGKANYGFRIIRNNDNSENEEIDIKEYGYENMPKEPENMSVNYEYVDGQYIVGGDEVFMYKKILVGKDKTAACLGKYIVLTNNPDVTFEMVSKSLYSSNMDDWLNDTIIIGMEALTESFDCFAVWPTKSTRISADYNEKDHPETDISGKTGDSVYAIADGTIIFAGWEEGYGNTVKLLSSNAVIEYHHLNSISVKECDEVRARDVIGELGNTGLSTGPHLGISLTVNGDSKNLVDYYVENTPIGYIEIKPAKVNLDAKTGEYSDLAKILYADKKKIIFSAAYGLFVYSKEDMTVTQSMDLTYIGCDSTQGDDYCEQFVSSDGEMVYLHPINKNYMFVYAVRSNTLRKESFSLEGISLHEKAKEKKQSVEGYDFDIYMDGNEKRIVYLIQGFTLKELYYADLNYDDLPEYGVVDPVMHPLLHSDSIEKCETDYNFTANIDLPQGYSLSSFYQYGGYGGCFYIEPLSYELNQVEEGTPFEWFYSGMIGKAPANITNITYKNGIPELSGVRIENHTTANYLEVIGLERSNNQWPAIMLEESHDLYTQAEIEAMKEQGIDTSKLDLVGDYWYFWFVKEGADNYYVLSLSKKEFSKEEAIKIAKSLTIQE